MKNEFAGKSSEDAVEKVLAGLREVDPPAGMERRILQAVQERAAAVPQRAARRRKPGWLEAWGTAGALSRAACGAGLLSLSVVALTLTHRPVARLRQAPPQAQKPKGVAAWVPARVDATRRVATLRVVDGSERNAGAPALKRVPRVDEASPRVSALEGCVESFPSPPLPMTEQERLLVRIAGSVARRGRRQALDAADPLAAADAEEKAEFEEFFKAPPSPQEPTTAANDVQPATEKGDGR